jgi:Ion transport protein
MYCGYNVIDRQSLSTVHTIYRDQKHEEFTLVVKLIEKLCKNNCSYFKSYMLFFT